MLHDSLEGWDRGWVGEKLKREVIYTYILTADLCCPMAETITIL